MARLREILKEDHSDVIVKRIKVPLSTFLRFNLYLLSNPEDAGLFGIPFEEDNTIVEGHAEFEFVSGRKETVKIFDLV